MIQNLWNAVNQTAVFGSLNYAASGGEVSQDMGESVVHISLFFGAKSLFEYSIELNMRLKGLDETTKKTLVYAASFMTTVCLSGLVYYMTGRTVEPIENAKSWGPYAASSFVITQAFPALKKIF